MAHAHNPAHEHDGPHHHDHTPANYNMAFGVGMVLNFGFVVLETIFGLSAHSMALLADAGHNLSDVLALLLAWGAMLLATRRPTERHTYGLRRSSILAALANATILLIGMGAIAWEAIRRLAHPSAVSAQTVIWVAAAGIGVNGVTALLFLSGRKGDVNIEGAFLHMAADAVVAAGVVATGILILLTHWLWLDPVVSLLVAAAVVAAKWELLRKSVNLAMDAVPESIDPAAVRDYLQNLSGVTAVHDLHIWGMSTTETALTAHLVRPTPGDEDGLLAEATQQLHDRFGIAHPTLQIERREEGCKLASEQSV